MKRVVRGTVTILYVCCLCYLVFFARRREGMQQAPAGALVNLTPVVNQVTTYQMMDKHSAKEVRNYFANIFGNVLLFLPFSVLLIAYGQTDRKRIVAAALVTSLSIEITQYLLSIGVADVDDILLNVAGAYLGLLLFSHARKTPAFAKGNVPISKTTPEINR